MPEDVDARMLDPEARKELRSLTRETADLVARHLVMTGRLLDENPQQALAHARAARAMAGRIGVVREASGFAAYAAGEWAEALSELRAARRITGRPEHLAVLADCERALDRPERALAYADDPAVPSLPQEDRVELVIVVAGARRDLGQADAAVVTLQDPARRTTAKRPWAARLWYAYADALLAAGREEEARDWFTRAAEVDEDGSTDASDRLLELDGVVLDDEYDDEDAAEGALDDHELAAVVAEAFPRAASAAPRGGRDGEHGVVRPAGDGDASRPAAPEAAAAAESPTGQAAAEPEPGTAADPKAAPQPGAAADPESPAEAVEGASARADRHPATDSGQDTRRHVEDAQVVGRSRTPFSALVDEAAVAASSDRPVPPAAALTPSFVSPPSGPDDELALSDED